MGTFACSTHIDLCLHFYLVRWTRSCLFVTNACYVQTANMKFLKTYIWIGSFFLLIAIVFGVYVWYTIQNIENQSEHLERIEKQIDESVSTKKEPPSVSNETATQQTPATNESKPESAPESVPESERVIELSTLSDSQREILKTFGYTSSEITITDSMITCAKTAVGEERFASILGGAAPTPLEALGLVPCFGKE